MKKRKTNKSPLKCVMRLKSLATRLILLVHTNIMESVKASRNFARCEERPPVTDRFPS